MWKGGCVEMCGRGGCVEGGLWEEQCGRGAVWKAGLWEDCGGDGGCGRGSGGGAKEGGARSADLRERLRIEGGWERETHAVVSTCMHGGVACGFRIRHACGATAQASREGGDQQYPCIAIQGARKQQRRHRRRQAQAEA